MPIAAGNALGGRALLYYLIPYAAMSVGAFAVVAVRERELRAPVTLRNLAGFGWERPFLGASMALFMFGFIGFPPAGIFLGKFYVFSAVIDRGWALLAIVGVVATAVSVYYYAGVIRAMYMQPRASWPSSPRAARLRPTGRSSARSPAQVWSPSVASSSPTPARHRHGRRRLPLVSQPERVVVLGAGATGEAFVSTLRRLDPEAEITVVEHELVGGECSYWACIPSKTMLRPLEVVARARLAPRCPRGRAGRWTQARVFRWRDSVAEKDDTSQAEWLAKQGATLVRGTGTVVEPGLLFAGEQELPYDALLVATGSVPIVPPIDGLAELGHWGSREATTATPCRTLAVIGGGAVGCELSQAYALASARGSAGAAAAPPPSCRYRGCRHPRRRPGAGRNQHPPARRPRGRRRGRFHRVELEDRADRCRTAPRRDRPPAERRGLRTRALDLRIGKRGIEVDDRLEAGEGVWAAGDVTGVALFTHVGKYQGRSRRRTWRRGTRAPTTARSPASIFTDPQVATVGDTSGGRGHLVPETRIRLAHRDLPARSSRASSSSSLTRAGACWSAPPRSGRRPASGSASSRSQSVPEVSIDVLRDTIQPFPTFSEADVYFAARDLEL